MTNHRVRGIAVSGASMAAIEAYERALGGLQCYVGDPVADVERAVADSPAFVMGRVLHAYLHLMGTEPSGLDAARADLSAAREYPASAHEQAHIAAAEHLLAGRWHGAGRVLEDIAIEHPTDILALQVGHLVDFYTGQSRMLRDRIARALPFWSSDAPGYHVMLGMHAFGLEETGMYDRAEAQGRRAVEIEPRDGWAQHAVAHVMEMQGRQREGIAWMRSNPEAWSRDSFFAVHNWWHLALFHLDLGQLAEVLALYDGPIYGPRSQVILDMVDASALLWRLQLLGMDASSRWESVADAWEGAGIASHASHYAFNDAHAMMAFVGAGRHEPRQALLDTQERALAEEGDNRWFLKDVGVPVTRAILAFGEGNHAEVVRLLRPVRNRAHRFGGSHAQRDVLDLTLIESAFRSGQRALARALIAERADVKPQSPLNRTLLRRWVEGG